MEQQTVKATLHITKEVSSGHIFLTTHSMERFGYITIGTEEVEVEVPLEYDEEAAIVNMKKAKREAVEKEFQEALSLLD